MKSKNYIETLESRHLMGGGSREGCPETAPCEPSDLECKRNEVALHPECYMTLEQYRYLLLESSQYSYYGMLNNEGEIVGPRLEGYSSEPFLYSQGKMLSIEDTIKIKNADEVVEITTENTISTTDTF